jgi:archaemetzincin
MSHTEKFRSGRFVRRQFFKLASALALAEHAARAASAPLIYLAPLGDGLANEDFDFVERALVAFYAVEVRRLAREALPKSAYYAKRKRYRAERLLSFLEARMPEGGLRILGVTGADISTSKPPHDDWGILGLANMSQPPCVVSSFRCKRMAKNAEHVRVRLGKTCVHEIGHTFGLPHCPTEGCLMHDGEGSVLTTDSESDLCGSLCRPRLLRSGYALSSSADMPWPIAKSSR